MKYFTLTAAFLCAALIIGISSSKAADEETQWKKTHEVCKTDREKLCANKAGEEGLKCMREHMSELSADCSAALKMADEQRAKLHAACNADINKLCAEQKGKRHKAIECLRDHTADLQPGCAEFIKSIKTQ